MVTNTLDPDESADLLGHFAGTVEKEFWSTPIEEAPDDNKPTYPGADKLKLYWSVRVDDVLQEDYDGVIPETLTLSWSTGSGWWAEDTGRYARHNDDADDAEIEAGNAKPKTFKHNSGLGGFLLMLKTGEGYDNDNKSVKVMDGGGEVEYDLHPDLRDYLVDNDLVDSRDAQIWHGMKFEFRGLGLKYEGSEFKIRMQPLPVKWLGVDDEVEAGGGEIGTPAEAKAINPAARSQTWLDLGATDVTAGTLVTLATHSSSHASFAKNALLLEDVQLNEKLNEGVMNEENWSG